MLRRTGSPFLKYFMVIGKEGLNACIELNLAASSNFQKGKNCCFDQNVSCGQQEMELEIPASEQESRWASTSLAVAGSSEVFEQNRLVVCYSFLIVQSDLEVICWSQHCLKHTGIAHWNNWFQFDFLDQEKRAFWHILMLCLGAGCSG